MNADAAQLRATSPLQRAQDITRPVLLACGERGRRVPLVHGTRPRDALKEAGKAEVEWVAYEEEGDGWARVRTRLDFCARVEAFLARELK